jgi:hypothetical protein
MATTLPTVIAIGTYAALPAFGIQGRIYFATDTLKIWYDTGTAWVDVTPASGGKAENITLFIDGGGSVISAGSKAFTSVPFAGTIQSITLLADQSGSAVLDVWKTTYANYDPGTHPVVADSITASAPPTISSSYKATDSTLTGWTTAIAAGDLLQFVVNSASTITKLMLVLTVERS